MWEFCSKLGQPDIIQHQPGSRRRSAKTKRSSTAAAAAGAAVAMEQDDAPSSSFADFTDQFGPLDYMTTALSSFFKLQPGTAAHPLRDWPRAVLESYGIEDPDQQVMLQLVEVCCSMQ